MKPNQIKIDLPVIYWRLVDGERKFDPVLTAVSMIARLIHHGRKVFKVKVYGFDDMISIDHLEPVTDKTLEKAKQSGLLRVVNKDFTSKLFRIAEGIEVNCSQYFAPTEEHPFILDVSVDIEPGCQYSTSVGFQTRDTRDCAYADFDEKAALKFYQTGTRFVNS